MPNISTSLRLLVLAVATSFALTSCFDRDKKCDPKPKTNASCSTPTPPPTPTPVP
jgi:hypothetical protein